MRNEAGEEPFLTRNVQFPAREMVFRLRREGSAGGEFISAWGEMTLAGSDFISARGEMTFAEGDFVFA